MIIDFDKNPNLSDRERLNSLKESVQMAMDEARANCSLKYKIINTNRTIPNYTGAGGSSSGGSSGPAGAVKWDSIKDKPVVFPPSYHSHDDLYYPKTELDDVLKEKADTTHKHDELYYPKLDVDTKLSKKTDIGHTHDEIYYPKPDVDTFLSKKTDIGHIHNDLYYGKGEIDTKLTEKAEREHTHDTLYYQKKDVDAKLTGKADTTHEHNAKYYLKAEVDTKLLEKTDVGHKHDELYYPQKDVDAKLLNKADATHSHKEYLTSVTWGNVLNKPLDFTPKAHTHLKSEISDFPIIPSKISELENDSNFISEVSWGIIKGKPEAFPAATHSHSEYALSTSVPTKVSQLTNDSGYLISTDIASKQEKLVSGTNIKTINGNSVLGSGDLLIGGGGTSSWDEIVGKPTQFSPTPHNHDDLYYPKKEIDTKFTSKADAIHTHADYLKSDAIAPWAKSATKPSYTWSEIGNKPAIAYYTVVRVVQ